MSNTQKNKLLTNNQSKIMAKFINDIGDTLNKDCANQWGGDMLELLCCTIGVYIGEASINSELDIEISQYAGKRILDIATQIRARNGE